MKGKGYAFLCGTPKDSCEGSKINVSHGLGLMSKGHMSPVDAFNCYKRYLLKIGYQQVGPREFAAPNNGPITVLTKKSRYGGRLRSGKEGTRFMGTNHRAGTIIG